MALILSAGWSEENSLEQQHHQEAAELNPACEANVNVDELPPLHHLIRLDCRLRAKQVVRALDGRGDLIQRWVPQLKDESSGKARSHTPAPRGQARRKLLTGPS